MYIVLYIEDIVDCGLPFRFFFTKINKKCWQIVSFVSRLIRWEVLPQPHPFSTRLYTICTRKTINEKPASQKGTPYNFLLLFFLPDTLFTLCGSKEKHAQTKYTKKKTTKKTKAKLWNAINNLLSLSKGVELTIPYVTINCDKTYYKQ